MTVIVFFLINLIRSHQLNNFIQYWRYVISNPNFPLLVFCKVEVSSHGLSKILSAGRPFLQIKPSSVPRHSGSHRLPPLVVEDEHVAMRT